MNLLFSSGIVGIVKGSYSRTIYDIYRNLYEKTDPGSHEFIVNRGHSHWDLTLFVSRLTSSLRKFAISCYPF